MNKSHTSPPRLRCGAIAILSASLLVAGCSVLPSHLHNEGHDALAKTAVQKWNELAAKAPDMYAAMSVNVERFKVEEDKILADLAENHRSALIAVLPSLREDELKTMAQKGGEAAGVFLDQEIPEAAAKLSAATQAAVTAKKDAEQSIEDLKKAVTKEKKNVEAWNAYVAILRKGIAELPAALKSSKELTISDLPSIGKTLKGQQVSYADAEGKIVTESLSTAIGKVTGRLSGRLGLFGKNGVGQDEIAALFPKAPGINAIILNLQLDLAQVDRRKAEARLTQIHAEAIVFEDAMSEMRLARQLYAEVEQAVGAGVRQARVTLANLWDNAANGLRTGVAEQKTTIGDNLAALEDRTVKPLEDVRKLALAERIRARQTALLPVRIARLHHLASITNSTFADEAHQALIRRGLEGLSAYHAGGFTKEDAARLARIAQAVALGVMAEKTN